MTLSNFDLVTDLGIDGSIFPEKLSTEAQVLFTRLADQPVWGDSYHILFVDIDSTTGRLVRTKLRELQRARLVKLGCGHVLYRQEWNGHRIVEFTVRLTDDGNQLRGSVLEQY